MEFRRLHKAICFYRFFSQLSIYRSPIKMVYTYIFRKNAVLTSIAYVRFFYHAAAILHFFIVRIATVGICIYTAQMREWDIGQKRSKLLCVRICSNSMRLNWFGCEHKKPAKL